MYESRIAADHLTVAAVEGFPPEINPALDEPAAAARVVPLTPVKEFHHG